MARKVHPLQESSASNDESNACSSSKQVSFFHLEESLDLLIELYSKQQRILSDKEANDLLEENVDLLDLCQVLTDRINKVKSYTDLLISVSRYLDAVKAGDLMQSTSLSARASKAIDFAAKYRIPSVSSSCIGVLRSAGTVRNRGTVDSASLMKAICRVLTISEPGKKASSLRIRGVFKKVLCGCRQGLYELDVPQVNILRLQSECKKNCKGGILQPEAVREISGELRKSPATLAKAVASVEMKLQKLYQLLLRRQIALLDSSFIN